MNDLVLRRMIFVLIGQDVYRREERAKIIFTAYLVKHPPATAEVFDVSSDVDVIHFFEFCRTPGLFHPFRLAILKNLNEAEKVGELKKHLKNLEDDSHMIVLISENRIIKDFVFLNHMPNKVENFGALPREAFVEFIKKEAKIRGANLDASASSFLADVFRGDSLGVVNELQKLSFLGGAPVSADFLSHEENFRLPHDFFLLLRGLLGQSMPAKLKNFELLLSLNEDPAKIFNVLAYLDLPNIKKFADHDVLIKSGKLDYEEALLEIAIS